MRSAYRDNPHEDYLSFLDRVFPKQEKASGQLPAGGGANSDTRRMQTRNPTPPTDARRKAQLGIRDCSCQHCLDQLRQYVFQGGTYFSPLSYSSQQHLTKSSDVKQSDLDDNSFTLNSTYEDNSRRQTSFRSPAEAPYAKDDLPKFPSSVLLTKTEEKFQAKPRTTVNGSWDNSPANCSNLTVPQYTVVISQLVGSQDSGNKLRERLTDVTKPSVPSSSKFVTALMVDAPKQSKPRPQPSANDFLQKNIPDTAQQKDVSNGQENPAMVITNEYASLGLEGIKTSSALVELVVPIQATEKQQLPKMKPGDPAVLQVDTNTIQASKSIGKRDSGKGIFLIVAEGGELDATVYKCTKEVEEEAYTAEEPIASLYATYSIRIGVG